MENHTRSLIHSLHVQPVDYFWNQSSLLLCGSPDALIYSTKRRSNLHSTYLEWWLPNRSVAWSQSLPSKLLCHLSNNETINAWCTSSNNQSSNYQYTILSSLQPEDRSLWARIFIPCGTSAICAASIMRLPTKWCELNFVRLKCIPC